MAPVSMRRERKDIDIKLSMFGLTGSLRMSNALARVLKASSAWGWVFCGDKRKDDELSHRNALYYYFNNFQHCTCKINKLLPILLIHDSPVKTLKSIWQFAPFNHAFLMQCYMNATFVFKHAYHCLKFNNTSESSNYCSMLPHIKHIKLK